MKRWLLLALLIVVAAFFGLMPFYGTDAADLRPVEAVRLRVTDGQFSVETDCGDHGRGDTLANAFRDLKETAPGNVFLETADYLIINDAAENYLTELCDYLRPGCGVCVETAETDLPDAVKYLNAHEPCVSLQDYRAEKQKLPILTEQGGRLYLAY